VPSQKSGWKINKSNSTRKGLVTASLSQLWK
jgi:hypothetical protein